MSPAGQNRPPEGAELDPRAVEMWRSLRDRPALRGPWTGAGTPRGQPGGLPTGCPHPCPPATRPSPHFHRWRPGGRNRRRNFDFFQPLLRANALRASLAPFVARPDGRGSRRSRGNPVGVPQGGRRGGQRPDRGAARPRPLGGPITPLWGAFGGGGGAARRVGEPPPGVPREAPSIERKTLH